MSEGLSVPVVQLIDDLRPPRYSICCLPCYFLLILLVLLLHSPYNRTPSHGTYQI